MNYEILFFSADLSGKSIPGVERRQRRKRNGGSGFMLVSKTFPPKRISRNGEQRNVVGMCWRGHYFFKIIYRGGFNSLDKIEEIIKTKL